ncbi:MAG: site-2 protease family protein, partial [Anaerolineales bacterium]|nr:site-2 protease family protein [Anaerolineales bacterium]
MLNIAPSMLIAHLFVLLTAFVVHEFAHAWTANYLGDDTPRLNGRLTLNPLSHLDPMGSILLLVAGFGWAKPVPVNPLALQRRSPAALMWVSLAGPMSNLLMAMVAAIPFRLGLLSVYDAQFAIATQDSHILPTFPQLIYVFIYINLLLMLFNLIPIAPLDGEKIA